MMEIHLHININIHGTHDNKTNQRSKGTDNQ